jgi:GAF domain-containing protein
MTMEPIPETQEAIDELEPVADVDDLVDGLRERARRVRELVPDCIGMSLASRTHHVTLTLVASSTEIAVLDGIQYLADGPCVRAMEESRVIEVDEGGFDVLDEEAWQLFAEATAATGVRSTLTLPILSEDVAVGTVNLYAGSRRAFEGLVEEIAEIFGAWAPGAVRNADLAFETRRQAQEAPGSLRESARIATAVGIISASQDIDEAAARTALREAAERAGVEEVRLAETIIELRHEPPRDAR